MTTKLTGGISSYRNAIHRVYAGRVGETIPSNATLEYNAEVGFTVNSGLVPIPSDTIRLGRICYWNNRETYPKTASAYKEVRAIILERIAQELAYENLDS